MSRYDIRDLFGHWVKVPPKANEDGMCPHRCCRGKRKHPDNFPVIMSDSELHQASDDDLMKHYQRADVGDNPRAVRRTIGELQRREDMATARQHRRAHKANRQEEYRQWLEGQWVSAEEATRGSMVNKAGRAKGIDPRSLWTASKATRDRYASDELRAYWDKHPILTEDEFTSEHGAARGARRHRSERLYGVY